MFSKKKTVSYVVTTRLNIKCYVFYRYVYVADVMAKNIHVLKKHDNWNLTQEKVRAPQLAHTARLHIYLIFDPGMVLRTHGCLYF